MLRKVQGTESPSAFLKITQRRIHPALPVKCVAPWGGTIDVVRLTPNSAVTFLRRLRRSFWRTLRFSTKERLQFGISERDPRAGPTTTWSWDPEEKRPAHTERRHARSCEALYRLSEGVGPGENCLRATSGQAQTPVWVWRTQSQGVTVGFDVRGEEARGTVEHFVIIY